MCTGCLDTADGRGPQLNRPQIVAVFRFNAHVRPRKVGVGWRRSNIHVHITHSRNVGVGDDDSAFVARPVAVDIDRGSLQTVERERRVITTCSIKLNAIQIVRGRMCHGSIAERKHRCAYFCRHSGRGIEIQPNQVVGSCVSRTA